MGEKVERNPIQRLKDREDARTYAKINEGEDPPAPPRRSFGEQLEKEFLPFGYSLKQQKLDKEAKDAALNRKEAEAEGQRYKKGGLVRRGYGKARGA